MRKIICIITVCIMIITIVSGCGVLQKLGIQKSKDDGSHPASSIVMGEGDAKKLTDSVPVQLYFANEDNTKLKLEVRYIPLIEAKKSVNNLAGIIVKELIKGPSSNTGLKATMPEGTQLRSPISINGGVATVDLTSEFKDKHPGGKVAEQLTIFSIVNSLTELKEIEKVKFVINGKEQKEFKGSYKFDNPFTRSTSIISKDVPPAGTGSDDKKKDSPKDNGSSPSDGDKSKSTGTSDEQAEETYLDNIE